MPNYSLHSGDEYNVICSKDGNERKIVPVNVDTRDYLSCLEAEADGDCTVSIAVGQLRNVNGMIVTLNAYGVLRINYLGTDPG